MPHSGLLSVSVALHVSSQWLMCNGGWALADLQGSHSSKLFPPGLPTVTRDIGSASSRKCQVSRALPLHFQLWATYTFMLP